VDNSRRGESVVPRDGLRVVSITAGAGIRLSVRPNRAGGHGRRTSARRESPEKHQVPRYQPRNGGQGQAAPQDRRTCIVEKCQGDAENHETAYGRNAVVSRLRPWLSPSYPDLPAPDAAPTLDLACPLQSTRRGQWQPLAQLRSELRP